jgi:hypothetical protein
MTAERGARGGLARRLAWVVVAVLASACQGPTQRVPLTLEPDRVSVFVDGEPLSEVPMELELRSDRAHVLFFRREGYRAERRVLQTRMREGEPWLTPAEVHVRLLPTVPRESDLVIEPSAP